MALLGQSSSKKCMGYPYKRCRLEIRTIVQITVHLSIPTDGWQEYLCHMATSAFRPDGTIPLNGAQLSPHSSALRASGVLPTLTLRELQQQASPSLESNTCPWSFASRARVTYKHPIGQNGSFSTGDIRLSLFALVFDCL
jgi:hypothetical protein